ncbi:hypothetical protein [Dyadobacter sediminis]|uniref:Uncharacterized protein n=1 Tax=Dyadobacter sediminis TaxID=1493691 RepID=A0A5R9KFE4_9BACT|nr:hypothetical protein [Dyadobacter sediminis]TLU94843.1 hypothetical protein FEM55_11545 [Dyadobacter sediminis]
MLRLFLIAASGIILVVGLSSNLQRQIFEWGLIPDQYRFGDLYNVSNLKKFKETDMQQNSQLTEADKPAKRFDHVDLYTIGDSFTPMDTSFYAGRNNYHIWLGVNVDTARLHPDRKSILVIEIIERTIQERLKSDYRKLYINMGFQFENKPATNKPAEKTDPASFWWDQFGHQINQRLEFLLFNSEPFLKIKELKAGIMLSWFNRTHTGSLVSANREYIFYDVEANPKSVLSPFAAVGPASVDTVVTNMNAIRDYYKNAGFDEVYFCLLPNKVTVCEPDRSVYNNQITRIEQHPALKAPFLSLHREIRRHPEWFHKGDGHWNVHGKRLWLRHVNKLVEEWSVSKSAAIR